MLGPCSTHVRCALVAIPMFGSFACAADSPTVPGPPIAASSAALWPSRAHDDAHTRRATVAAARSPSLKWSRTLMPDVSDQVRVAIDGAGRLVVGNHDGARLLSREGEDLWVKQLGIATEVAWPAPDLVLVAADKLYAFDVTGRERWSRACDAAMARPSSVVVDDERNVYFGCLRQLQAVTRDGAPKWSQEVVPVEENVLEPPLRVDDRLLVTTVKGIAAMSSSDGRHLWYTAATAASGFYSGGSTSMVNPSTKQIWRIESAARARIDLDGAVLEQTRDTGLVQAAAIAGGAADTSRVVIATGSGIRAYDDIGAPTWQIALQGLVSALAVDADDVVVAATRTEVLGVRRGEVLWRVAIRATGQPIQVAIGARGDVLVASNASELFCLGDLDSP